MARRLPLFFFLIVLVEPGPIQQYIKEVDDSAPQFVCKQFATSVQLSASAYTVEDVLKAAGLSLSEFILLNPQGVISLSNEDNLESTKLFPGNKIKSDQEFCIAGYYVYNK